MNDIFMPRRTACREGRFTNQDGLSLHFRDYGDPRSDRLPIMCFAGVTQNSRFYHRFALHAAARYGRRILALDFRGRGGSDNDPQWNRYRWQTYASDIVQWLEHLKIERAIALGTSMGGLSVLVMAGAHADLLGGLILNDVGPALDLSTSRRFLPATGRTVQYASFEEAARTMKRYLQRIYPRISDEGWNRLAWETLRRDEDGMVRHDFDPNLGQALRAQLASGFFDANDDGAGRDLWRRWENMSAIPTLLIRGMESDILSTETAARMQATHPRMTLCEVPEAGHVPTLDEPAALRAIDDFLASLP